MTSPTGGYKVSIELSAKVKDYVNGMGLAAKATKGLLDAQKGLSGSSADLAASLTATGAAARAASGDVKAQARAVSSLERAHRKLNETRSKSKPGITAENLLPDPAAIRRAGEQAGETVTAGLKGSLATPVLGPVVAVALVSAAALAAPLMGAAIIGGVLAAVGGGAIGAGVAASLRSTEVKASINELKSDLGDLADGIGDDFSTEVRSSIVFLDRSLATLGPDIRSALAPAAAYLEPLTKGLVGFVDNALPGIGQAIEAASPIFDVISASLPELGTTVGDFFVTLSEHADEGAAAVQTVIFVVQDIIKITGIAVGVLADIYEGMILVGQAATTVGAIITPDWLGGQFVKDLAVDFDILADTAKGGANGINTAISGVVRSVFSAVEPTEAFTARQDLLNGSMTDGIAAAGGLAQALNVLTGGAVDAERAEIAYQAAIDKATEGIKENGRSLDKNTEKGRENRANLLDIRDAAVQRAQAAFDSAAASGTQAEAEAAAATQVERGRKQLIATYLQYDNNKGRAKAYADQILKIPKQWSTKLIVESAAAEQRLRTAAAILATLKDKTITLTTVESIIKQDEALARRKPSVKAKRWGGVSTPMAVGGIGDIYPASNPPLYRYAEPETGGEAFIPRKGNKARGRMLVGEVASWYGMQATPMARGGVAIPAASGLVSVAAAGGGGGRLASEDAYISARNAVTSLNTALKDNGRTLSLNTAKGRANRSELNSGIKAAQAAAEAKFEETGSYSQANLVYSESIRRLKSVLQQQGVNASTTKRLLAQLSSRPTYGAGVSDSSANIAFAKDQMSFADASSTAMGFFDKSWGRPSFGTGSAFGRDNLTELFSYLEAAGSAAQSRYAQTGSEKTATALYDKYVRQLRQILADAGMSKREISKLVSQYGRISLTSNATGGIHMDKAMAMPAGGTLYGWREPSTGGEAFIPRNGDRARNERILQVASGWQGGRYVRGGQAGSGSGSMTVRVVVDDGAVAGLVSVVVDEQLGALADAHVYSTAG